VVAQRAAKDALDLLQSVDERVAVHVESGCGADEAEAVFRPGQQGLRLNDDVVGLPEG
jgi:hypothetical protein